MDTKTTKTMELVKQYSTKNQVIVPSFTGEHIPTGCHTLVKTNDDWELHSYHGMRFDEAFIINDEQLDSHWESLKDELKDTLNNFIGDDEFYDYFPDLYMSLQYIAMARSIKNGSGDSGFLYMMDPIKHQVIEYGPNPEEPDDDEEKLIDQCDDLTMEMFRELNPNFGK